MNNNNFENDPFMIKHRKRTSKRQLEVLEKTFETCIRPDAKLRRKLGDQLNMTPRAVQIWFQNRRAKIKKMNGEVGKKKKGREMMYSAYGKDIPSEGYCDVYTGNEQYGYPGEQVAYAEQMYPTEVYQGDQMAYTEDNVYNDESNYNLVYNNTVPSYYEYPYTNEEYVPYTDENMNNKQYGYPEYYNIYPSVYHKHHDEYYHKMYMDSKDTKSGFIPHPNTYYYYDENNEGHYTEKEDE